MSIKDLPFVTVEQVVALLEAVIKLESQLAESKEDAERNSRLYNAEKITLQELRQVNREQEGGFLAVVSSADAMIANLEIKLSESNRQRDVYRDAIQQYMDGDYSNPRSFRPNKCQHDKSYWEDCDTCTEVHFTKAIATATGKGGEG